MALLSQLRNASPTASKSGSGYKSIPQHEPDEVTSSVSPRRQSHTPRRQMMRAQINASPVMAFTQSWPNSPTNAEGGPSPTNVAPRREGGPTDPMMQKVLQAKKYPAPSSNVPTLEEALPWHTHPSRNSYFSMAYWRTVTLQDVIESTSFQTFTVMLIFGNAVIIGFETDMPDLCPWDVIENLFLACFTIELGLRLGVIGPSKFFQWNNNPDLTWNVFDFSIVTFGIANFLVAMVVADGYKAGSNATIFRMVRLLRILRVLRIIRIVRFLKQLYLLAYGFVEGAMAVFWVTLLASFALYICSVILVRTFGRISLDDDPNAEFFQAYFGDIPRCMFNLFELLCAPDLQVYHEIMFQYPSLVIFLVTFIILGSFGINGLLVALINESILEKNQARLEADRLERESKRKIMQQRCRELFDTIDVNRNRVLPRSEIIKCKDQIMQLFESSGVNFRSHDLDQMFYIMDVNDTGIIERSEFAQAVVELCDQIRPMSIMELHYQVSKCANKIEACDAKMDGVVKQVEEFGLHGQENIQQAEQLVGQLRNILLFKQPATQTIEECSEASRSNQPLFTSEPANVTRQRSHQRLPLDASLRGHQRLLAEARQRVEAILRTDEYDLNKNVGFSKEDLSELGGSLFRLQRGTSDVLSSLFTHSMMASGKSRGSNWRLPFGRQTTP